MSTRHGVRGNFRSGAAATSLFSALWSHYEEDSIRNHIDDFVCSPSGYLWFDNSFYVEMEGSIGEYGYIQRDVTGQRFVCLGHINNFLGRRASTKIASHSWRKGGYICWNDINEWPNSIFR